MSISSNNQAFVSSNNSILSLCNLAKPSNMNLLAKVDIYRTIANLQMTQNNKGSMGQFLTPAPVAELMAEMFDQLGCNQQT